MHWCTLPLVVLIGLGGMLLPDGPDPDNDTTEPVPHGR
jgi:hypothetical protein